MNSNMLNGKNNNVIWEQILKSPYKANQEKVVFFACLIIVL